MTPAEALEQVRALHAPSGVYVPEDDECAVCQQPWPCETAAILDAVTTDAPVTVEEERQALVEIMRDRDDMFVTFEMHADAILAAGFRRALATPERTVQERLGLSSAITDALHRNSPHLNRDQNDASASELYSKVLTAITAYECREVSE